MNHKLFLLFFQLIHFFQSVEPLKFDYKQVNGRCENEWSYPLRFVYESRDVEDFSDLINYVSSIKSHKFEFYWISNRYIKLRKGCKIIKSNGEMERRMCLTVDDTTPTICMKRKDLNHNLTFTSPPEISDQNNSFWFWITIVIMFVLVIIVLLMKTNVKKKEIFNMRSNSLSDLASTKIKVLGVRKQRLFSASRSYDRLNILTRDEKSNDEDQQIDLNDASSSNETKMETIGPFESPKEPGDQLDHTKEHFPLFCFLEGESK